MTTIAWDGKVLAADRLFGGNAPFPKLGTKIFTDGWILVGCTGAADFCASMVNWVLTGRDSAKFPAHQTTKDDWVQTLVIETDGTPVLYCQTPYGIRYAYGSFAIGSGSQIAETAMYLGKSAEEAIGIAAMFDPGSGGGVDILRLRA